jgi:hypothetical protein
VSTWHGDALNAALHAMQGSSPGRVAGLQGRKYFFFEKKKQKTFVPADWD